MACYRVKCYAVTRYGVTKYSTETCCKNGLKYFVLRFHLDPTQPEICHICGQFILHIWTFEVAYLDDLWFAPATTML